MRLFIGTPTDEIRTVKQPASATLTDLPFFSKHALAAANEDSDYVVSAYLAGQAPIGIKPFTANAYYLAPTIKRGKR